MAQKSENILKKDISFFSIPYIQIFPFFCLIFPNLFAAPFIHGQIFSFPGAR